MRTETCSVCHQEVRWGIRPPVATERYLHREDVDHEPKFGRLMTVADWAEIDRQLDLPRTREDGTVYTTRTWKSKGKADVEGEDQDAIDERKIIPAPEILARPITKGDEHWPGGCTTIANVVAKARGRWTASYSRGPRVHASHGTLLGISDYVVLRVALDDSDRRAVGFWVDSKFDHAWLATLTVLPQLDGLDSARYVIEPFAASSDQLKAWIRGE